MWVYQVTISPEASISTAYSSWLDDHMLQMLQTGCFTKAEKLQSLPLPHDESRPPDFTVMYFLDSKADFQKYLQDHAPSMRSAIPTEWQSKISVQRWLHNKG